MQITPIQSPNIFSMEESEKPHEMNSLDTPNEETPMIKPLKERQLVLVPSDEKKLTKFRFLPYKEAVIAMEFSDGSKEVINSAFTLLQRNREERAKSEISYLNLLKEGKSRFGKSLKKRGISLTLARAQELIQFRSISNPIL